MGDQQIPESLGMSEQQSEDGSHQARHCACKQGKAREAKQAAFIPALGNVVVWRVCVTSGAAGHVTSSGMMSTTCLLCEAADRNNDHRHCLTNTT
jgi:hypothetical protein